MLGIITGLIYTLLLTRNMSKAEYGIWTNIFDYTAYFILFGSVLPFWVTRFTARGKQGTVKTSVYTQLTLGVVSLLIYLPAIFLISHAIGTTGYLLIYLLAGLYILNFFMVAVFESVLQAIKPQAVGYGFIIQEVVKVVVAVILILGFKEIFFGAIMGLVVACFVQILYYLYLLFDYFKERANWGYVKEWIKGSPAIAFNAIGSQLVTFVLILLFLYAGSDARAYYQAALSFTVIVGYSSSLALALYPKLLANSCSEKEVGLSFRTVMMLGIPLATLTIVMSVSFLTILKDFYAPGWPVLVALTIDALIGLIYTFYTSCLFGVESFDAEGKISIRKLVRSKIFKVFAIPYIQAAIALPLTYFVLTRLPVVDPIISTVDVVVILISVHLASFIGLYLYMRHSIRIPVAWRILAKYIFSALIMGILLYLLPTTSTLLSTITKALGGFSIYVLILLAIDAQARELVREIWEEIRHSKQANNQGNNSGIPSS